MSSEIGAIKSNAFVLSPNKNFFNLYLLTLLPCCLFCPTSWVIVVYLLDPLPRSAMGH